jgi:hypothetical protein
MKLLKMTKLQTAREKAKEILSSDKFEQIDNHIESIGVSGTKKAQIWEDFLSGKMILDTWVEPTNLSDEELSKIDEDIKLRGKDAILDILNRQMMIPENLKVHLRRKYNKELVEAKEIIHKKKYSIK